MQLQENIVMQSVCKLLSCYILILNRRGGKGKDRRGGGGKGEKRVGGKERRERARG